MYPIMLCVITLFRGEINRFDKNLMQVHPQPRRLTTIPTVMASKNIGYAKLICLPLALRPIPVKFIPAKKPFKQYKV